MSENRRGISWHTLYSIDIYARNVTFALSFWLEGRLSSQPTHCTD